jgi:ABC-type spermidine/putrescine transport system permease subunit II
MKTGVTPEINALATIMLVVTIIIFFLAGIPGMRKRRHKEKIAQMERSTL